MASGVEEKGMSMGGRVAAVAALALAAFFAAYLLMGGGDTYRVTAHFQTAGQLVHGNLVQTAGHRIGLVKEIELAENGEAEVVLEIEKGYAPLREGTVATIRQPSLSSVAGRYVDLQFPPGEQQRTIPDGGTITVDQTTTAVDIDQFFNMFDRKTQRGLRNFIRGFGETYEGKAREANEGWEYLTPSFVATRRLWQELTYDRRALQRFLVSNSKLVTDLSTRREQLTGLVDGLADTFGALASEKDSLQQAVAELPPFMRRANTTFVNLRATLDDFEPLIEESIPVTPKLRRVLGELRPFAREAVPTFRMLADIIRRSGSDNDLIELAKATIPFSRVATKPAIYNGKERPGSFQTSAESLKGQTPQWAFQRPYVVDFTGWFDDFSHSGIYDANGSASRVSTTVSAFAFLNGTLQPVPENLRAETIGRVAALNQRNRCPGSTERPAEDKSNPFKPSPDFNCDETQLPPGN